MKVAVLKNGEVLQTYVQLTSIEAERIISFLQQQLKDGAMPASHSERTVYENFTECRSRPEMSKGLFTLAIVEN